MSSELNIQKCPICETNYEVESIYENRNGHSEIVSEKRQDCLCPPEEQKDTSVTDFTETEVFKCIIEGDKDRLAEIMDAKRIAAMPLEKRMELMKHTVSYVDSDFIDMFALKNNPVPKEYFWKVKVDNPRLAVSDYIQHIWDIQRNGASAEDATLRTFDTRRLIDGKWTSVVGGITVFNYQFFIKRIQGNESYENYTMESGIGDYFNVYTGKVEQQSFATCNVYRKDRKYPTPYTAWLPEFIKFKKGTDEPTRSWGNPKKMLNKIATGNAHKLAFPIEVGNINIDYETMEV